MEDSSSGRNSGDFGDDFDDELINAEFESMVEGLNLDQSTPTSYLDELDAIAASEKYNPDVEKFGGVRAFLRKALAAIDRWRKRPFRDDDGIVL